jgi:hypothetical protein
MLTALGVYPLAGIAFGLLRKQSKQVLKNAEAVNRFVGARA